MNQITDREMLHYLALQIEERLNQFLGETLAGTAKFKYTMKDDSDRVSLVLVSWRYLDQRIAEWLRGDYKLVVCKAPHLVNAWEITFSTVADGQEILNHVEGEMLAMASV